METLNMIIQFIQEYAYYIGIGIVGIFTILYSIAINKCYKIKRIYRYLTTQLEGREKEVANLIASVNDKVIYNKQRDAGYDELRNQIIIREQLVTNRENAQSLKEDEAAKIIEAIREMNNKYIEDMQVAKEFIKAADGKLDELKEALVINSLLITIRTQFGYDNTKQFKADLEAFVKAKNNLTITDNSKISKGKHEAIIAHGNEVHEKLHKELTKRKFKVGDVCKIVSNKSKYPHFFNINEFVEIDEVLTTSYSTVNKHGTTQVVYGCDLAKTRKANFSITKRNEKGVDDE